METPSGNPRGVLHGVLDRFESPRSLSGWVLNSEREGNGRDIVVSVRYDGRIIGKAPLEYPRFDLVQNPDYMVGFKLVCTEDIPDEAVAFGSLSIEAHDTHGRSCQIGIYDRAKAIAAVRHLAAMPSFADTSAAAILTCLAQSPNLPEGARQALARCRDTYLESGGATADSTGLGRSRSTAMAKRVAVISDTIAADQLFQVWYRYYSRLFGAKNLYVVTYRNMSSQFAGIELGGLWEIPEEYNDPIRAQVISSLVTALLSTYDYIVRGDIDELIVPDPRSAPDLATYINALDYQRNPYVTGRGLEVVQTATDAPLNLLAPILVQQRKYVFGNSGLNKTCITSVPIDWGNGFHAGTIYPKLCDLYIFHLKFSDLSGRLQWFRSLIEHAPDNLAGQKYWTGGIAGIEVMQESISKRPKTSGWQDFVGHEFDEKFLATVEMDPIARRYQGKFFLDDALREIPKEFSGML
jgi:hypothetical protein